MSARVSGRPSARAALALAVLALGCYESRNLGSSVPHGLLPVDERNPILLTNDGAYDNWQGEYAILLANEVHANAWINVPYHATDDYVTQLAQLIKSTLDPSLNVYVEFSNEVWNTAFEQGAANVRAGRWRAVVAASLIAGVGTSVTVVIGGAVATAS